MRTSDQRAWGPPRDLLDLEAVVPLMPKEMVGFYSRFYAAQLGHDESDGAELPWHDWNLRAKASSEDRERVKYVHLLRFGGRLGSR